MRVLIIGGTGSVGTEITKRLIEQGYDVSVLCRSEKSENKAEELGARPLRGDITSPENWVESVSIFDAIIHAAATFDLDMSEVDEKLLFALFSSMPLGKKLIYTGGVWLFGDTATLINEDARYKPPKGWDWMAKGASRVLENDNIWGMVIHPGNVVEPEIGVPPILIQEAESTKRVHIPLPEHATWPLVFKQDLAELYSLVLERGVYSESYIGVSESGANLGNLGRNTAIHLNLSQELVVQPIPYWIERYGEWASGYGLSQKASGEKARTSFDWVPKFEI